MTDLLCHRPMPGGRINGQQLPAMPPPVPCEVCGAPVYLMEFTDFCRPDIVIRKVAELASEHWQWARHRCGEQATGVSAPPCQKCQRLQREWALGILAEGRRALARIEQDNPFSEQQT